MEKAELTQDLPGEASVTGYYLSNSVGLFKAAEKDLTESHFNWQNMVLSVLTHHFLNSLTFQWKVNHQFPFCYQNTLCF